uniref:Auxin Efflux Carrier n=1 Tax=uncultured bacterium Contig1757 TaxID=1393500 RepID=W0FP97_9BACT|nr:auxin Efflux Carrier [uncultured bacterium Contig1757]
MDALFLVFIKIVVAVTLGFILRKTGIIDARMQKGLSDMLLLAILPFSILASSNYEKTPEVTEGMQIVLVAALAYYILSLILMRLTSKKLPFEDKEQRVFVTMTVFANTGFVGFPLMSALYGNAGLLMAVVFNLAYNLFMYTYGIHLLSGKTGSIRSILTNPVNIASVLAILIFVSPFRFPSYVSGPIDLIAAMTVPLSMIIIGSNLAAMPFFKVVTDPKSYLISFMRLILLPGLVLAGMYIAFRSASMAPEAAAVAVLMCALPCGSMNVILSEKYDCAPEFAARATVQSMLLCMGSLPLFVFICSKIFR